MISELKKNSSKVLIVGLPRFSKKIAYKVDAYLSRNIIPVLVISEHRQSALNNSYSSYVVNGGRSRFEKIKTVIDACSVHKPIAMDCYDYSILTIFFLLCARFFGIKARLWLIGSELTGDIENSKNQGFNAQIRIRIKVIATHLCLYLCDEIIAKEIHQIEHITNFSKAIKHKTSLIPNAVPLQPKSSNCVNIHLKDFIFANSVTETRNVQQLIKSINELKLRNISFSASILGFSSISTVAADARGFRYSEETLKLIQSLDLLGVIEVEGFVENIENYLRQHKFFVFPADRIFANYALLEAMSLGIIPIVSKGLGYELIVKDGINGIVIRDQNITDALERALGMEANEVKEMAFAARKTIERDYCLDKWADKITANLRPSAIR